MSPSGEAVSPYTAAELWRLEGRRAAGEAADLDLKMNEAREKIEELKAALAGFQQQKDKLLEGVEQCNEATAWFVMKGGMPERLRAQEPEHKVEVTGREG